MKKYVLTAAVIMMATSAFAVITGSKHDMSATGPSSSYGRSGVDQICVYCHAPHNAIQSALIWNRNNTQATITAYDKTASSTLSYNTAAALHEVSKVCLGCHDGTIAIDEYGSVAGSNKITNTKKLGTDLRLSHPIGFSMTESGLNDNDIADPSGGTVGYSATKLRLFGGSNDQLECATCHDVHNKNNQSALLVMNNAASALCLNCHAK